MIYVIFMSGFLVKKFIDLSLKLINGITQINKINK